MRAVVTFIGDVSLLILATSLVSYVFGQSQGAWDVIVIGMLTVGSLLVALSYVRLESGYRAQNLMWKAILVAVAWFVLAYGLLSFAPPVVETIGNLLDSVRAAIAP